MSVETLALPRLGETMETGRVAGWLKKPGERFKRGETIVEIESDKTVVELPALADGTLVEILAPEGSDIDVGAPLCTFDDGATRSEPSDSGPTGGGSGDAVATLESDAVAAVETAPEQPVEAAPAYEERPLRTAPTPVADRVAPADRGAPADRDAHAGRVRATPLARRAARAHGIDLLSVQGSGRRGRIELRDIPREAAAAGDRALSCHTWEAQGAGRGTAVLLHGFGGDGQTWAALAAALSRRGIRVVAPDLPGHGATALEAADGQALIDGVVGFLSTLDGPFELVGHSLGGPAAVAAARAFPGRVSRLTLIAPAGLGTEIDADFVAGIAAAGTPGLLAHLLRRLAVRPPVLSAAQLDAMTATLGAGRLAGLASAIVRDGRQTLDIVPELASLAVPTRIVWGLEDRIIPWRHVLQAPSRVALHLVANAGHMPHWDQPGDVAALFD